MVGDGKKENFYIQRSIGLVSKQFAVLVGPQVTIPEIIATAWQNPCIQLFKHPMPL